MSATPEERLAQENRRLRQELEALQSQAQAWQSEKQAFQTQVQELETIRRNLEHTVALYKRCLFGSRSEKIDPKELEARIAKAAAQAREQLAQELWRSAKLSHLCSDKLIHPLRAGSGGSSFQVVAFSK